MKVTKRLLVLNKLSFILAVAYTLLLTVASLMHLNNVPDLKVDHVDKIAHFAAYAILCFLWFLAFRLQLKKEYKKAIFNAALVSILFGILIEILQGTLTNYRSLDVYDALANTIGALLTVVMVILKQKLGVKN